VGMPEDEHERVHRGRLEQAKMWGRSAKAGKVEVDKVVTQDEGLPPARSSRRANA